MKRPEAYILWREWKDGSIAGATCTSRTQLEKQITRDTGKAVRMWSQTIGFDPESCQPVN
jgi:hypothetical protein